MCAKLTYLGNRRKTIKEACQDFRPSLDLLDVQKFSPNRSEKGMTTRQNLQIAFKLRNANKLCWRCALGLLHYGPTNKGIRQNHTSNDLHSASRQAQVSQTQGKRPKPALPSRNLVAKTCDGAFGFSTQRGRSQESTTLDTKISLASRSSRTKKDARDQNGPLLGDIDRLGETRSKGSHEHEIAKRIYSRRKALDTLNQRRHYATEAVRLAIHNLLGNTKLNGYDSFRILSQVLVMACWMMSEMPCPYQHTVKIPYELISRTGNSSSIRMRSHISPLCQL